MALPNEPFSSKNIPDQKKAKYVYNIVTDDYGILGINSA